VSVLGLIRTIGLILITMLATVFFIQNLATAEVAFLFWSISAPRAVIFLLVFVSGLIGGYLLNALRPKRPRAPSQARIEVAPRANEPPEARE
jgi:uncharacterized integral membrane protein